MRKRLSESIENKLGTNTDLLLLEVLILWAPVRIESRVENIREHSRAKCADSNEIEYYIASVDVQQSCRKRRSRVCSSVY